MGGIQEVTGSGGTAWMWGGWVREAGLNIILVNIQNKKPGGHGAHLLNQAGGENRRGEQEAGRERWWCLTWRHPIGNWILGRDVAGDNCGSVIGY